MNINFSTMSINGKTIEMRGSLIYVNGKLHVPAEASASETEDGSIRLEMDRDGKVVGDVHGDLVIRGLAAHPITLIIEGDVKGSVNCDGSVTCHRVGGSATAGGDLQTESVGGSANAGGDIRAGKIGGSANAGGNIFRG